MKQIAFYYVLLVNDQMQHQTHYGTVSEALAAYRELGFILDFNLSENSIVCGDDKFVADEFEIADVYRYEGDTDPADEATVYAIQSSTGLKGVLVTGYGASSDLKSDEILRKLR